MIDIRHARINTAGAYVCIHGYYLFAIGIQRPNGHIPIIRLGGHRERYETGWQCAAREVFEEANLQIAPLLPRTSYVSDWDHTDEDLQEIQWQNKIEPEPVPLLVVTYSRDADTHFSLMYLAHADGLPEASSEVKGLLLVTKEEVHLLCQESLTLHQYLSRGDKAIMDGEFDPKLVLEPFAQLRLLSRLLSIQSETKAQFA